MEMVSVNKKIGERESMTPPFGHQGKVLGIGASTVCEKQH